MYITKIYKTVISFIFTISLFFVVLFSCFGMFFAETSDAVIKVLSDYRFIISVIGLIGTTILIHFFNKKNDLKETWHLKSMSICMLIPFSLLTYMMTLGLIFTGKTDFTMFSIEKIIGAIILFLSGAVIFIILHFKKEH